MTTENTDIQITTSAPSALVQTSTSGQIKQWLLNHSITAKTFIPVWVFLTILWATSPEFKDYVYGIYTALPKGVHNFLAGVIIPAIVLWNTRKKTIATLETTPGEAGSKGSTSTSINGKLAALALCGFLMMVPTGCNLVKAAPQPGVAQFYPNAALLLNNASGILVQAQASIENAHTMGAIDDANFQKAEQGFLAVATNMESARSLVKAGAAQQTVVDAITAIINQAAGMPAAFSVKDPQSQAAFTALVNAFALLLKSSTVMIQAQAPAPVKTAFLYVPDASGRSKAYLAVLQPLRIAPRLA